MLIIQLRIVSFYLDIGNFEQFFISPILANLPDLSFTILSKFRTVVNRCAIKMIVKFFHSPSTASMTASSVSLSRALVASSKTMTDESLYKARAMQSDLLVTQSFCKSGGIVNTKTITRPDHCIVLVQAGRIFYPFVISREVFEKQDPQRQRVKDYF